MHFYGQTYGQMNMCNAYLLTYINFMYLNINRLFLTINMQISPTNFNDMLITQRTKDTLIENVNFNPTKKKLQN